MRMVVLILISWVCLSGYVFADKVLIAGAPVPLKKHPGYYSFPKDYNKLHQSYHFVTFLQTRWICYLNTRPSLKNVNMTPIVIYMDGNQLRWYCYEYHPGHFEHDTRIVNPKKWGTTEIKPDVPDKEQEYY